MWTAIGGKSSAGSAGIEAFLCDGIAAAFYPLPSHAGAGQGYDTEQEKLCTAKYWNLLVEL